VSPAENNAFKAINRAWRAGGVVHFVRGSGADSSRYVITNLPAATSRELARDYALNATFVAPPAGAPPRPRLGVLENNTGMDEGWTRWVLGAYGFDFVRVPPAELAAGRLLDRVDVLLLTDDQRALEGGRGRGAGAATPEMAATNAARVRALDEFVRAGGTLVCLNSASSFAIDQLKLPLTNVLAGVNRQTFFAGRSLLKVQVDAAHQATAGMPEQAFVMFNNSPVFQTSDGFRGTVLARYPESDTPLASGFLLGEKLIQGKAAAVDVELGDGHVVLFGFSPQWRGQTFGTFRMLFNALLTPLSRR
jgi:hypothetical protein